MRCAYCGRRFIATLTWRPEYRRWFGPWLGPKCGTLGLGVKDMRGWKTLRWDARPKAHE